MEEKIDGFFCRYWIELSEETKRCVEKSGLYIQTSDQVFKQSVALLKKECEYKEYSKILKQYKEILKRIIKFWIKMEEKV
jgi:hypothetical protein